MSLLTMRNVSKTYRTGSIRVQALKNIDLEMIKDFHQDLLTGVKDQIAGQIRNKKVVIGKYTGQSKEAASLEIKHEPPYHQKDKIKKS